MTILATTALPLVELCDVRVHVRFYLNKLVKPKDLIIVVILQTLKMEENGSQLCSPHFLFYFLSISSSPRSYLELGEILSRCAKSVNKQNLLNSQLNDGTQLMRSFSRCHHRLCLYLQRVAYIYLNQTVHHFQVGITHSTHYRLSSMLYPQEQQNKVTKIRQEIK